MVIDHICRARNCVNPAHLQVCTNRENILRGVGPTAINARKTHCPNGHPLSWDNIRYRRGTKSCKICHYKNDAKRRARRRRENV